MRFPARGTSDEDDPMRIRAQVCVSTSAMWRLLRPSPHTYTYAYTYTYVYSYTHICMYMCATRMHLSNLRKLIRCVFLREAHLTKMIRCGFVRKVVSVRVQCGGDLDIGDLDLYRFWRQLSQNLTNLDKIKTNKDK